MIAINIKELTDKLIAELKEKKSISIKEFTEYLIKTENISTAIASDIVNRIVTSGAVRVQLVSKKFIL